MTVRNHIVRGEHILIGFLRGFFRQDELFHNLRNEFRYQDNREVDSLIIEMNDSFDQESENATPALILQEGGWNEHQGHIDQRETHQWPDTEHKKATLKYNYTIHCVTQKKGAVKFLQAAVSKGIIGFRKLIYELGINKIYPMQGTPPENMSPPDANEPGPYNARIRLQIAMDQDFILIKGGEPEEAVEFKVTNAIDTIDRDDSGNITNDAGEYFQQNFNA